MVNREEGQVPSRFEQFVERLEINQRYYSVRDPANMTLGIFAAAALKGLEEPFFRQQVEEVLEARPELSPSTTVKLFERVYQADLLQHDRENYPSRYSTIKSWLEAFATIEDDMIRGGVVGSNLRGRSLQSNIAERYKSIKIIAALLGDRFDEPPSHLDVGSSVLHGSIKLAYNDILPFGEIDIVEAKGDKEYQTNRYLTKLANTALRGQVVFGPMMGVDIMSFDDAVTREWVRSCSFYPDELLDEDKVREYEILEKLDPNHHRISVFSDDFADLDFNAFRDVSPSGSYDIITFSTIFYLLDEHERSAMLDNANRLLSPRGIIVIQDAIDGDFSKSYNYVTSVIDSGDRHPTEQIVFQWKTPRCMTAALGMGKICLGGRLHTIDEALEKRFEQ